MATNPRRIHYGTPCEFRAVTQHAQLERFDNKPAPRYPSEITQSEKSSASSKSIACCLPKLTGAGLINFPGEAAKNEHMEQRGTGGDYSGGGQATEFDKRTMYTG